ncbi:uncharacterized protein LOC131907739 [Peromyscus eremicus]|uniref:uncharacterized protein LOC131907739 n=1 Tax=Peromyscus eremicus TaxID=42410 RepID=UPI0027DE96ED|nr:uncharacterized protein LOC131907739 [Peromyscus eremicus]
MNSSSDNCVYAATLPSSNTHFVYVCITTCNFNILVSRDLLYSFSEKQCFDHIHPLCPTLPMSIPFLTHPFCMLFKPIKASLCCPVILECVIFPLEHGQLITVFQLLLLKCIHLSAEPGKEGTSREEQRKHDGLEKAQSLIASEHIPQKQDVITLTVTTDQRRQTKPTMLMKGPCKEETSTEDERKCDSRESVQSLVRNNLNRRI